MSETSQKISEGLIKVDIEVKKCYETQIRTFSIFDLKLFERLVLDHQISNILDIGCGEGSFILHIAKKFPELNIHAVEIIPNLLAESKIKQNEQNIRNIYFENTIFDENFPKSKCDLITARFAVEHMQNVPYFFDCAYQYLNSGGMIAITEYCVLTTGIYDPVWFEFRSRELELYQKIHSCPDVSFQIPHFLQKRGFKNISSIFYQVSPSTVGCDQFYDLVDIYASIYHKLDSLGWTEAFVSNIHNWTVKQRKNLDSDPAMWLTQTIAEK